MTQTFTKKLLSVVLVLVVLVLSFQSAMLAVLSASSDSDYDEHKKNTVTWQMINDGEYYFRDDDKNYYLLNATTETKKKKTYYYVSFAANGKTYYLKKDNSETKLKKLETSTQDWESSSQEYTKASLYTKKSGGSQESSSQESSKTSGTIIDGTYSAVSSSSYKKDGQTYYVKVTIVISGGKITSFSAVPVANASGTTSIALTKDNQVRFDKAVDGTSSRTGIEKQVTGKDAGSYKVDTVSHATRSSDLIISALANAVAQAGGTVPSDPTPPSSQTKIVTWYKVSQVNADGTFDYGDSETSQCTYGQKPIYEGEKPAIPYDENFAYEFLGWSTVSNDTVGVPEGKLDTVSDDSPNVYYAIFKKIPHLSYQKSVKETADNVYELSLNVTGKARNITTTNSDSSQKYDVIVAIDRSNSMKTEDVGSGYESRMQSTKAIVKTFVHNLYKNNTQNRIAILTYGGVYDIKQDWTDTSSETVSDKIIDGITYYSSNSNSDKNVPNGTNYTAGLCGAEYLLQTRRTGSDVQTIVLFLSDGMPNAWYSQFDTKTVSNKNDSHTKSAEVTSDTDEYKNTYVLKGKGEFKERGTVSVNQAISKVPSIQEKIDGFYAVALYSDSEDDANTYLKSLTDAFGVNGSLFRYTNVADVNENLKDVLDNFTTTVPMNPKGVVITDTLSSYVELTSSDLLTNATVTKTVTKNDSIDVADSDYSLDYVISTKKEITLKFNPNYELEEGATYTLTVPIQATSKAINEGASKYNATGDAGTGTNSAGEKGFYSNDSATVTYRYGDDDEYKYTLNYQKPVIQVTAVPTYTVTYNTNGGSPNITDSNNYKAGDTVTVKGTPTKNGYNFKGWRYNGILYQVSSTFFMPGNNVTLVAEWEPVYTVTYDLNGGSSSPTITDSHKYESGDTVTVSTVVPTKDGYTFKGWTLDNTTVGSTFTMPSKNVTLKAIWEEDAEPVYLLTVDSPIIFDLDTLTFVEGADDESGWEVEQNGELLIWAQPKNIVFTKDGKSISTRTEGRGVRWSSEDDTIAQGDGDGKYTDWWIYIMGVPGETTVTASVVELEDDGITTRKVLATAPIKVIVLSTKRDMELSKKAVPTGDNTWNLELQAYANGVYKHYDSTGQVSVNGYKYNKNTWSGIYYQINGSADVSQDIYYSPDDGINYYKLYTQSTGIYYNNQWLAYSYSGYLNYADWPKLYVKSTDCTLDSSAVLKDVISDKFNLTSGATATAVVQKYNGTSWDTDTTLTAQLTTALIGRNVTVTGFDYQSYPYYGTATVPLTGDYKILVTINGINGIQTDSEQQDVETNTSTSGIYKNNTVSEPTAVFPIPTVTIPAKTEIPLTDVDTDNTAAYLLMAMPVLLAGLYFMVQRKKRTTSV